MGPKVERRKIEGMNQFRLLYIIHENVNETSCRSLNKENIFISKTEQEGKTDPI
jgi:hypothetical protein